jgi:hypothetical protein
MFYSCIFYGSVKVFLVTIREKYESRLTMTLLTDKINHDTDESRRHKLALYKPVPNNDFVIRGTLPNQSFLFFFSAPSVTPK